MFNESIKYPFLNFMNSRHYIALYELILILLNILIHLNCNCGYFSFIFLKMNIIHVIFYLMI
jgi:hypothetical protein